MTDRNRTLAKVECWFCGHYGRPLHCDANGCGEPHCEECWSNVEEYYEDEY